jgi:hypothetical protein
MRRAVFATGLFVEDNGGAPGISGISDFVAHRRTTARRLSAQLLGRPRQSQRRHRAGRRQRSGEYFRPSFDINGYFAPPAEGGLSLYTVTPCRVFDSRQVPGSLPVNGQINIQMTGGTCGIPNSVSAFVLNATVFPPGSMGFLALWPEGQSQPVVSTLNAVDGALTSNMAIVPGTNGWISAYVTAPTQLFLDVYGYFAP